MVIRFIKKACSAKTLQRNRPAGRQAETKSWNARTPARIQCCNSV